jgi:hypothetical protein
MRLRRHPRRFLRRLWPRPRPATTPRLVAVAPEFASELEHLLTTAGRPDLAESIPTLQIFGRCPCSDLACSSFFTLPWLDTLIFWRHAGETVALPARRGNVSVDVANGFIVAIEVLGRRDVWLALARLPLESGANATQVNGRR